MAMMRTAMSIYRELDLPTSEIATGMNRFLRDGLGGGLRVDHHQVFYKNGDVVRYPRLFVIDEGRPLLSRSFEVDRSYRFKKGSGLPVRIPVIEMVEIGAGGTLDDYYLHFWSGPHLVVVTAQNPGPSNSSFQNSPGLVRIGANVSCGMPRAYRSGSA